MIHVSVLLHESIDGLDIHQGEVFVDGTLGNGGHTREVLRRFGKNVKIIAIDADTEALVRSQKLLAEVAGDVTYIHGNFRNIDTLLGEKGITEVHKILLDIGFSSNQIEEGDRGFSFRANEPLDMRFDRDNTLTATEIVNTWDEENLRTIIRQYGEERWAGRIAKGIVRTRKMMPIKTTAELADIIVGSVPAYYAHARLHPATRTFQALRITVNDELQALVEGIEKGFHLLAPGGRIAVISFHSLEDRIVKNHFKTLEQTGLAVRVTKKPVIATEEEREENPRSRSAKLRIIEKI